ncbi:MAG: dimethyl sulfoxide reductase anchor subunit [Rhodospirillales bacterium]|nr:dimethyl sulfoxide reductase anchor subunit [Rhodospirillales bacterium]
MFEIRDDEPDYAILNDFVCAETNRYGKAIDLLAETHFAKNTSLRINGDEGVGENPNRNKQHGFHFTADNCIGCHACEAACSEKNDLPPHLAFRSVGYVEGGTYPDYTRVNISMACNHCDDPVCLKGCPTGAYTKHPEYGAVLQDPDICFGCGYCTWVCPYNAPQLDPVAGHVEKCNMCVDRLEVGLKPACVSACLGNALDFGVIENTPENREQIKTEIPGFPNPDITRPNIRFQQTRSLPRDFTRTDSMPVKYHKEETFVPIVDTAKVGAKRQWNLSDLSSRENPLVVFTLSTQACVGGFALPFLGGQMDLVTLSDFYIPYLIGLLSLQAFVLWLSTQHLGKPMRFYRGFNNLRHSPLSREALGIALFFGFLGGHMVATILAEGRLSLPFFTKALAMLVADVSGALAVLSGLAGLYFMNRIYRIPARPFWDHWQVMTSFFGASLSLGALLAWAVLPIEVVVIPLVAGLVLEGLGLLFHARDLKTRGGEGVASQHLQATRFGKTYLLRNALQALSIVAGAGLALASPEGVTATLLWAGLAVIVAATALIGRTLFYVLVIPTTMPGAFFWKNKAFEDHARETGLAAMPQVGVAPEGH